MSKRSRSRRQVSKRASGLPSKFDPAKTHTRNSEIDAVIEHAKRVKDWPMLERAIVKKIQEQSDFVGWWEKAVTPGHGGDRRKSAGRGTWSLIDAEKATEITHQQVSRWRKKLEDPERYREELFGSVYRQAMAENGDGPHVSHNSGENEWYTPMDYIEAARRVLGTIDLDPASTAVANEVIKATRFYTAEQNSLDVDWEGIVWMNPPYSAKLIDLFCDKFLKHYAAKQIPAGMILVNNATETRWFQALLRATRAVCFPAARVRFWAPDRIAQPLQGQAVFYFGPEEQLFFEEFSPFGFVIIGEWTGGEPDSV